MITAKQRARVLGATPTSVRKAMEFLLELIEELLAANAAPAIIVPEPAVDDEAFAFVEDKPKKGRRVSTPKQ